VSICGEPPVEPKSFSETSSQALQEVSDHSVGSVRLEQLLEVAELLEDKIRAERLGGLQNLLRDGACLVGLALGDESGHEAELSERPAAPSVAWAKRDHALSLTLRFVELAQLAHAPYRLAGQRSLVEVAHPL
jgi:hypothetical protein